NCKSAYAQSQAVGKVVKGAGSVGAQPALRGNSNLGRPDFGPGGFRRPFHGARSRLFGAPGLAGTTALWGTFGGSLPPSGSYDSLSCTLHRPVNTPHGRVYEPVYVC